MMKTSPKVSIGMPTYNRPESLRKALDGIIKQTYQNIEIIVSDNASPTSEIDEFMHDLVLNDSRITYFRQDKNIGAALNFQFVLSKASGDFFMWAADDDWRSHEFISELVLQHIRNPECSIAFSNFIAADELGNRVDTYPNFFSKMINFTNKSRTIRQLCYFLQPDNQGKANIFYGLIKKEYLIGFDYQYFNSNHGDMHLAFYLLGKGRLTLNEKVLFRSTVGNVKSYSRANSQKFRAIKTLIESLSESFISSIRYVGLSEGVINFFILFTVPMKFSQLFYLQQVRPILKKYIAIIK